MKFNRRHFLKSTLSAGVLAATPRSLPAAERFRPSVSQLDKTTAVPVLKADSIKSPVKIASIELLRNRKDYFVRTTSTDGAIGIAMTNSARMDYLYPILLKRVVPYFIGKDVRQLDSLIDGVFVYEGNYKLQGLAFWLCVASVEFGLLDLLGQVVGKPVGELLGGVIRRDIAVYRASGNRGNTPEREVAYLVKLVGETGAKAIKFKVGGRMHYNEDTIRRDKALIPLARKVLGDAMTIYVDSNGSYDAPKAIEVGRLLEAHNVSFFEEPCPFDQFEETKRVADALKIPIAGGEQESSLYRFRWAIQSDGLQIVQPDLHYFGGFIRSIRVARMAAEADIPCTVHMSSSGLGCLYMLHFASCVANVGPYQEYKGQSRIPISCDTSSLVSRNGIVKVPSGPGLGVTLDPNFVRKAERVE